MSHARIEEVSDSDPSEGDISDAMSDFDEREILKARPSAVPAPKPAASLINPSSIPTSSRRTDGTQFQSAEDDSKYKDFQCIYPVYFDKNRSRKEGRMVGKELAVENPMAREIVNACGRLRLETLFEPAKCHPKDWANPGRVKVKLRGGNNSSIKNKHHLYTMIAEHLRLYPTTTTTAQLVKVPGVPPPDPSKPYPTPAVPKGWKMGNILPYYSPAISGGGVSENFFKDMMAEMQGAGGGPGAGGMPGMPDMSAMQAMLGGMGGMGGAGPSGAAGGSGGAPKKDKKKKK
ncbi:signal recognition particle, SRP19 subunit [Mollisia scopiformis]|uniref:Signal recognition particle, SRP19 subunit n=1 Tax=Mollisia scopiformis TaxID=149040 RepID=A0A194XN86_MOLSC|nr:signal recognition particle, SRP19 subunit [Mollisia scopiformis]KUJ21559.1 signal recognition particle, SRP19 subunit [Mollisia scopiformis]